MAMCMPEPRSEKLSIACRRLRASGVSGERIALYKELDKIERDSELKEFEERLRDRFGRIPPTLRIFWYVS